MEVGSLLSHLMTQHKRVAVQRSQWDTLAKGRVPQEYRMSFLKKRGLQTCPVEGCAGKMAKKTAMPVHFVHWHVLNTLVMLEEGNFPHPRCVRCDMQVPWRELNGRHPGTAQCIKGAERKRQRLAESETRENSEQALKAYGEPIKSVSEFKYLARILLATDDDWPSVVGNLGKARRSWRRLSRVLVR